MVINMKETFREECSMGRGVTPGKTAIVILAALREAKEKVRVFGKPETELITKVVMTTT